MINIIVFKINIFVCGVNIRNLNDQLTFYFNIFRKKILTSLTDKIEKKIV